jgi:hypothetical protein
MDAVADLGCIVCRREGLGYSPAIIHHTYDGRKGGRDHRLVIPLCPRHHATDYPTGLHHGKEPWERIHGTEAQLLEEVRGLLEYGQEEIISKKT